MAWQVFERVKWGQSEIDPEEQWCNYWHSMTGLAPTRELAIEWASMRLRHSNEVCALYRSMGIPTRIVLARITFIVEVDDETHIDRRTGVVAAFYTLNGAPANAEGVVIPS